MARLSGKVAFITGAGSGIGREAALLFAREGANVIVAELMADQGRQTSAAIATEGGSAEFVRTDVSEPASVEQAVQSAVKRFGRIDILYNNAGGSSRGDGPVTEAPIDEFWRAIKLDLFGTFLCCKYALPSIIAAGGGAVINVSSMVALMGWPGKDAYTCAKGGISALTRSMALEYGPHNVRVNALAPGVVKTERTRKRVEAGLVEPSILRRHVLGLVEPKDVAHAALFLASEEARTITGQILSVDSGVTIC